MTVATQSQFAKHMGVNKSTVTRWKKAGRLVLAPNGKVMVEQSIAQIEATQGHRSDVTERHAQNRGHNIHTQPKTQHRATDLDDSTDMSAKAGDIGEDRAFYKALALDSKNQQDKLEQALVQGSRQFKEDYHSELSKQAGGIKSAIERLIDNLAPQIANAHTPKEVTEKLQQSVERINDQIH